MPLLLLEILGIKDDNPLVCYNKALLDKARRKQQKQYHPDKWPGIDRIISQSINIAYEILKDDYKTEAYLNIGERASVFQTTDWQELRKARELMEQLEKATQVPTPPPEQPRNDTPEQHEQTKADNQEEISGFAGLIVKEVTEHRARSRYGKQELKFRVNFENKSWLDGTWISLDEMAKYHEESLRGYLRTLEKKKPQLALIAIIKKFPEIVKYL